LHTIGKFDKFYLSPPACGRVLFHIQNLNLNDTSSLQSVSVRIMLRIPWLGLSSPSGRRALYGLFHRRHRPFGQGCHIVDDPNPRSCSLSYQGFQTLHSALRLRKQVVATWWTSAANGISLKELHYIWKRGDGFSFRSTLAAGPAARKIAQRMFVVMSIKVATAPLLQKATL
jgi:hypothetical protein